MSKVGVSAKADTPKRRFRSLKICDAGIEVSAEAEVPLLRKLQNLSQYSVTGPALSVYAVRTYIIYVCVSTHCLHVDSITTRAGTCTLRVGTCTFEICRNPPLSQFLRTPLGTGVQVFLCLSVLHRGNAALRNWGQAWHGKCQFVCVGPPLWRCMSCSRTAFLFFLRRSHSPMVEVAFLLWVLGHTPPPLFQCAVPLLEGNHVCRANCTVELTGSPRISTRRWMGWNNRVKVSPLCGS